MINSIKTYKDVLMMNTKQIASVLNKSHSNVKISAERLAQNGTIALQEFTFIHNNNAYTAYNLTKRDSIILVAQNSPEFTAKIVDRWQELENENNKIPQTYASALLLAANQAEQIEKQEEALKLAAPKVEFVDRFVESTGNKTFREVAKLLKANEREFRAFLVKSQVMYKLNKRWTARAPHLNAKRFSESSGEKNGRVFFECKFTPKGVEYIAGKWIAHKSG